MARRRSEEKRAFWRMVIQLQGESSLPIREFCAQEVSQKSLFAWRKVRQEPAAAKSHRPLQKLHFRRSDGEVKHGFEEPVKFAFVWGGRQSGEKFFVQHLAGNRAPPISVRGTAVSVVPGTRSAGSGSRSFCWCPG